MIRRAHDFRIVFDDQHRIADIPQSQENLYQTPRIARMKSDRRLVENVQCADQ
jgi:hypothetical protein